MGKKTNGKSVTHLSISLAMKMQLKNQNVLICVGKGGRDVQQRVSRSVSELSAMN